MKKIRRIFSWTFGGIGLVWLLVALGVMLWFEGTTEGMIRVPGRITDLSGGTPTVVYEVGGASYEMKGSTSSPTFRTGDDYDVYADPADPGRAVDPGLHVLAMVFGVLGVVFTGVGAGFCIVLKRREDRLELLRGCGLRGRGRVTRVYRNKSVKVNQRAPWVVEAVCAHPRLNAEVTASSVWLWDTALKPGDEVDVLFDPMNDRVYMVDTGEATA